MSTHTPTHTHTVIEREKGWVERERERESQKGTLESERVRGRIAALYHIIEFSLSLYSTVHTQHTHTTHMQYNLLYNIEYIK